MISSKTPSITFDLETIRQIFPILRVTPYGKPLVYLDNAATTQKPLSVLDAMHKYYTCMHSNVHRGIHYLSEQATTEYERARGIVRDFIKAEHHEEIIFTRGTTESINLVAATWGKTNLRKGDEILLTVMEHHSNIVPWQLVAEQTGAIIKVVQLEEDLSLSALRVCQAMSERTRIVSIAHVSNVLGIILPVEVIIDCAHKVGAVVLLDGAQAAAHYPVNVSALGCDFYAFSGHKVYGPTGIGILYGKRELLENMPPYQGGGDMIRRVTFERTYYNELPYKFEAGTPPIAEAIGLGAALEFIQQIGIDTIIAWEHELICHCLELIDSIGNIRILGPRDSRTSLVSFVVDGVHPHDLATLLDHEGIAVRAGHHCAQPLMDYIGIPATTRISVAVYNSIDEIEYAVNSLRRCIEFLR